MASKMRNCFGEVWKEKYQDLRLSSFSSEGQPITVSKTHIAVNWEVRGGGTIGGIRSDAVGTRRPNVSMFRGHKGAIHDLEFSPFYDTLFSSASEDCTVKIWEILPEGGEKEKYDAVATLTGHEKKVLFSTWNPVADWIVASGSADSTVKIWNVEAEENVFSARHPNAVNHIQWNYDGSLLASTCKDKMLRVLDGRQTSCAGEVECHNGNKASKIVWFGGNIAPSEYLLSVGNTKSAAREYAVWDIRSFVEPVVRATLDRNSGTITPFYDHSSGLVFFPGKGDGNMRFGEFNEGTLTVAQEFRSNTSAKACCWLPKRGVDLMRNEILRAYRVEGTGIIQPVTFRIPRRSTEFQQDLYPDCFSGNPSLATEKWLAGENAQPDLVPLRPCEDSVAAIPARSPNLVRSEKAKNAPVNNTSAALKKQLVEAGEVIRDIVEENKEKDQTLVTLQHGNSELSELVEGKEKEIESLRAIAATVDAHKANVEKLTAEVSDIKEQLKEYEELYRVCMTAIHYSQNIE